MQDGWSQFCSNCHFLLYKLSFYFAELSFYCIQTVVLNCLNCHFMVSLDFVRTVILFVRSFYSFRTVTLWLVSIFFELSFHFVPIVILFCSICQFYFVQTVILFCSNSHFMSSLDFVRTDISFRLNCNIILFKLSFHFLQTLFFLFRSHFILFDLSFHGCAQFCSNCHFILFELSFYFV